MTTAEWLARAHAVTDAATPGPWEAEHADKPDWLTEAIAADGRAEDHEPVSLVRVQGVPHGGAFVASPSWPFRNGHNDTEFIAASRTMLPAAVAAIEAVLALHRAVLVYGLADDCGCSEGDPDWDDHHFSTDVAGDLLCDKSPTGEQWCGECSQDEDGDGTTYPCPTVRDITAHLDPS